MKPKIGLTPKSINCLFNIENWSPKYCWSVVIKMAGNSNIVVISVFFFASQKNIVTLIFNALPHFMQLSKYCANTTHFFKSNPLYLLLGLIYSANLYLLRVNNEVLFLYHCDQAVFESAPHHLCPAGAWQNCALTAISFQLQNF